MLVSDLKTKVRNDALQILNTIQMLPVRNLNFWSERLYRGNIACEYIRRAGPGDMSGPRNV